MKNRVRLSEFFLNKVVPFGEKDIAYYENLRGTIVHREEKISRGPRRRGRWIELTVLWDNGTKMFLSEKHLADV